MPDLDPCETGTCTHRACLAPDPIPCHICGGSGNEPDGTCGECAGTGVLDCACPYRCHIHH